MGTDSFDIDALTGFSKYPVGRIGLDMTFAVSAREEIASGGRWLILFEPDFQVLNDGNGAGSEFSFGAAFSDDEFGANSSFGIKYILDVEGDAFRDTASGVETDGKESSVSNGVKGEALVKQ